MHELTALALRVEPSVDACCPFEGLVAAELALMRCPAPPRTRRVFLARVLSSARSWVGSAVCALALLVGLGCSPAFASPADAPADAPVFEGDPEQRSSNGAMLLRWDLELGVGDREYELQESGDPEFDDALVRYNGSFPS